MIGAVAEQNLAGRDVDESGDQVERRRLAAAGRTDQSHELPVLDFEREVIDGDDVAVGFHDLAQRQARHADFPSLCARLSRRSRKMDNIAVVPPCGGVVNERRTAFSGVSSFLALTTHQMAALRYDGVEPGRNPTLHSFARNSSLVQAASPSSTGHFALSYKSAATCPGTPPRRL